MKIRSAGSRVVPRGQTETHDEAKYSPVAILQTRFETANNGVFIYLHTQSEDSEDKVFIRFFFFLFRGAVTCRPARYSTA